MAELFRKDANGDSIWGTEYSMTEDLIDAWNSCIRKGDRVYFLGDLSFGNRSETAEAISRLRGQIHFIRGNHDSPVDKHAHQFVTFGPYKEITVDKQKIVLSHYPFLEWNLAHRGSWHLHGHQHGNGAPTTIPRLDVGIDCGLNGWGPVHMDVIFDIMKDREWEPVSHH